MKTHIILILVFGLFVYATTTDVISESENGAQTTNSFNDPQTTEKSFDITTEPEIIPNLKDVDTSMEIVIEETVKAPYNLLNEAAPEFDFGEISANEGDFYNDVIHKDPNEIMDTAAGFAPLPFLKTRRKSQRPYATRRFFQKPYAYRRFQYFYPYYYGFYRPSSLRYYSYY